MSGNQKCRVCGRRKGRRACPALGEPICAACCGTKRLVEIDCPSDCTYLHSSRVHPPAAVQRQRERDLRFFFPLVHGLTEAQQHLTLLVQGFLRRDRPDAPALVDEDVSHAAKALADTYETASRGIIYEHGAGIPSAERLSAELRALIDEAQQSDGVRLSDADIAATLRRIETGARTARSLLPGDDVAYLQLLRRVLDASRTAADDPDAVDVDDRQGGSGLIVPGQ